MPGRRAGEAVLLDACDDDETRGDDEMRGDDETRVDGVRRWGVRSGATDGGSADADAALLTGRAGRAGGGVEERVGVTGTSRDDWRRMRGSGRTASSATVLRTGAGR